MEYLLALSIALLFIMVVWCKMPEDISGFRAGSSWKTISLARPNYGPKFARSRWLDGLDVADDPKPPEGHGTPAQIEEPSTKKEDSPCRFYTGSRLTPMKDSGMACDDLQWYNSIYHGGVSTNVGVDFCDNKIKL